MFCPNCGSPCRDNALFCGNCGFAMMMAAPAESPVEEPIIEPQPEPESVQPEQPFEAESAEETEPATEPVHEPEPEPVQSEPVFTQPEPEPAAYQQPNYNGYQQPNYNGYQQPQYDQAAWQQNHAGYQQPNYAAYQQPGYAVYQQPRPVYKRPKTSIAGKIFSVLFCIILVPLLFLTLCCNALRSFTLESTITTMIESVDILKIPTGEGVTITDTIVDLAAEAGTDLSEKEIRDVLENSELTEELSGLIANMGAYALGDSNAEMPTSDDLKDLLEKACDELGIDIPEEEWELADDELAEFDSFMEEFESAELIGDEELQLIENAQKALSVTVLAILAAISALVIAIIFLINRRRYAGFCYTGVCMVLSGGLICGIAALFNMLVSDLPSDELASTMIDGLKAIVESTFMQSGLIACAAGAVLIVAYIICSILSKNKYRKLNQGL